MQEILKQLREQRVLLAALRAQTKLRKERVATPVTKGPTVRRLLLLEMAEGLIAAHKAAMIDDDGYTLDLIEDAMRHVGERLAAECSDGRTFSRKRLAPR